MDTTASVSEKTIRNITIKIDRSICIGAATCVALAPKAWALDNEAKAILLNTANSETDESLFASAKGCPVGAIRIIDTATGKQLFP